MSDIANKKLFENDRVTVWEMALEPGESTGVHTHTRDYFFQVLSGSTIQTLDRNGSALGEFTMETGSTHYFTIDGEDLIYGDIRVPATHEARNMGSERYYEILVELK